MNCRYAKISCEEYKFKACFDSWIDEYIVLSLLQKEGSRTGDIPSVDSIKKDPDYDYFFIFPLISGIGFRHLIHLGILKKRDSH